MVKLGAVPCILLIDPQFSIDLQLIGGVIILQTLPAVALGSYTSAVPPLGSGRRLVRRHGLGTLMLYQILNAAGTKLHFGGSAFPPSKWFDPTIIGLDAKSTVYVGFIAVVVNLVVAVLVTSPAGPRRPPTGVTSPGPTTTSPTRATRGSDRPRSTTSPRRTRTPSRCPDRSYGRGAVVTPITAPRSLMVPILLRRRGWRGRCRRRGRPRRWRRGGHRPAVCGPVAHRGTPPAMLAGATTATAAQFTGPNTPNATTVAMATTADTAALQGVDPGQALVQEPVPTRRPA